MRVTILGTTWITRAEYDRVFTEFYDVEVPCLTFLTDEQKNSIGATIELFKRRLFEEKNA